VHTPNSALCNDNNVCTTETCNATYGCLVSAWSTAASCNCTAAECGTSLPAGHTCHCDSACQSFNDCCRGVGSTCGYWDNVEGCDVWECGGQGGPANPASCYCDLSCVTFGDCCTAAGATGPC
jgi:hypothetical protein